MNVNENDKYQRLMNRINEIKKNKNKFLKEPPKRIFQFRRNQKKVENNTKEEMTLNTKQQLKSNGINIFALTPNR